MSRSLLDADQCTRGAYDDANEAFRVVANDLVPSQYDTVTLSYTGSNLTGVVYSLDGSTVGTLTLTYDGSSNLLTVVRS